MISGLGWVVETRTGWAKRLGLEADGEIICDRVIKDGFITGLHKGLD